MWLSISLLLIGVGVALDILVPYPVDATSLADAPDGALFLAWIEGRGARADAWFAIVRIPGLGSLKAIRLNANVGKAFQGAEEDASIIIDGKGGVIVTWMELHPGGNARIFATRSSDGGRTFSAPIPVSHRTQVSYRKGHRAVLASGIIYMAWIEGEDLYLTRSLDGGRTFEPERAIARKICDCCAPSLAMDERERLYIAFRNNNRNIRNIVLMYSDDKGQTFSRRVPVADGDWLLNGCPISGPALAIFRGEVLVTWMDMRDGKPKLYLARSNSRGERFGRNEIISPPSSEAPNHPTLVAEDDGTLHLAWEDAAAGAVYYQRREAGAQAWQTPIDVAGASGISGHRNPEMPRMKLLAPGVLMVVWQGEEKNRRKVYWAFVKDNRVTADIP
jgi:hypothetical protein